MTSGASPTASGPVVEARRLAVGYPGRTVVSEVDFVLEKGRLLALVGANGSGKSTLLRTIASLLRPLSGDVRVLGGAPGAFPGRVAYLGQYHPPAFVLPLRAIDVVRMARYAALGLTGRATRDDERRVVSAMEVMGVAGLRDEPLDRLSGGQRQRVFIAQALARGAELLLLDEPAANLDRGSRETYRATLRSAADAGCSAIVATHDIEEAASADQAMLLAQRVVAFGPGREVLTAEALLSTFGVVVRQGEGGVAVIEPNRDHDCAECGGVP